MTRNLIAAFLTTSVILSGCAANAGARVAAPIELAPAEAPAQGSNPVAAPTFSGTVSPAWTVNIVPRTPGTVVELRVSVGQQVKQGDVIAVLDHRSLDDAVLQAEANVSSAQSRLNSLLAGARSEDTAAADANASAVAEQARAADANAESARQRLTAAQNGGREESVAQAQAKWDADNAALQKVVNGATQFELNNAKIALDQAKDKLWADQTALDYQQARGLFSNDQRRSALIADQAAIDSAANAYAKLAAPGRPEDLVAARALVAADDQAVALARQPSRVEDIAQLEQAVTAAEAQAAQAHQLANAQSSIAAKAARPFTNEDLAQGRAGVAVAQALLRSAQTAQSDSTITAPDSGTVSEVPAALGTLASVTSPIATLISNDLDVNINVEEDRIASVHEGQPAAINTPAVKDVQGKVSQIAPAADIRTRAFAVKVRPQPGSGLRPGMSAVVALQ